MNISSDIVFSALANSTRLRCLMLLIENHELCVCELTHAIGAAQPHISRHLAHLREATLVSDRREGLWIYYRINPALPAWVTNVLRETAEGVRAMTPFAEDLNALKEMPNRPGAPRCA
jgi:ArsR family transcriptional regulator